MKKRDILLVMAAGLLVLGCRKDQSRQVQQASTQAASQSSSRPQTILSNSEAAEPQSVICNEEYEASAGDPVSGPFDSPCGRWSASTESDNGCVAVIVSDNRTGSKRKVLNSPRTVGYFWISSSKGSSLILNHYECSDSARALIYDPCDDKTRELDKEALPVFRKQVPGAARFDHEYAAAVANRGDELLLQVWGHGNGCSGEMFFVAKTESGKLVQMFQKRNEVPREWLYFTGTGLLADAMADFEGDMDGGIRIGMSIRIENRRITGTYFYAKYLKDIRIEGNVNGRSVTIYEFDSGGKKTGVFEGTFVLKDPKGKFGGSDRLDREVIVGNWSKPDGTGKRQFYLSMNSAGFSKDGKRYSNAGFEDDQSVDAFMQEFRRCILANDRQKAAGMVAFPVAVDLRGKRVLIHTEKEFAMNWDSIMTPEFRARVEQAVPFHMFANYKGAMLGSGEVWIGPVGTKPSSGKMVFNTKVIAINNKPWPQ